MNKIVRTVCQGCHSECGVLVHTVNGKITGIAGDPDHPSSRGFICIKGKIYHEFLDQPTRLKTPLKRAGAKGEGKWQPISWDEALDEIALKLTEIKDRYDIAVIQSNQKFSFVDKKPREVKVIG